MSDDLMTFIQTSSIIVWAVAQTLFVFVYGSQPWYRHYIGRAMFIKSLALMSLVDEAVISMSFDYGWEDEIHTVIIVFGTIASIWQLFAFVKQISNAWLRGTGRATYDRV